LIAAALVLMVGCGGKSPSAPGTPTPTPTKPGPTPTPEVGSVPCDIGPGDPTAACKVVTSRLRGDVSAAIDALAARKPDLFDSTGRVLDKDGYLHGVMEELRAAGFCADLDFNKLSTIQVKRDGSFSEDFDIYEEETGSIRRGNASYLRTCKPASFPLAVDPNGPPPGSGCGRPYPPPVTRWVVKIHVRIGGVWTLDSSPLVGPDVNYCRSIDYTDGRIFCRIRPEGNPRFTDGPACEEWRVGRADDTGRPGPTWTRDGALCTGVGSHCENHPDNQYQLLVYQPNGGGTYVACADNGVCGEEVVPD